MAEDRATRRAPRGGLMVNDAELRERLGVPEKVFRRTIAALDANRQSGFPRKQAHWGGRRYWPAIERWLERTGGFPQDNPVDKRSA